MTAHRHRREEGFTLIEVMVAALILVTGMTALASVLIGASNQATAAVTESQLLNVADSQIELVRTDVAASGFAALAMAAVPAAATLPPGTAALRLATWTDADRWVTQGTAGASSSAACFQIQANYDGSTTAAPPVSFTPWNNCQITGAEPLAVLPTLTPTATLPAPIVSVATQGSGSWPPPACPAAPSVVTPCTQTLGPGLQAVIYTFVTYTYSGCSAANASQASCPTLNSSGTVTGCPSTGLPAATSGSTPCGDSRRVTIAVLPVQTHSLSRQTPLYLSSVFTNPLPSTGQPSQIGLTVQ